MDYSMKGYEVTSYEISCNQLNLLIRENYLCLEN